MKIKPKKTTLKNGIRVITAKSDGTNTVTVLMFFKTGSRYEDPKLQGISHVLEHMIFKGTKKRPDSLDISRELDRVGADFNAFTAQDYTGYYVKTTLEHVEMVFDILGDMLLNSLFDAKELAREKGPVIEEIKMYDESPSARVDLESYSNLFGKTNLGRPIGGSAKTVMGMTRKDIVDYYRSHYYAENLIVGIAGSFQEKKVLDLAKKHLTKFSDGNTQTFKPVQLNVTEPRVRIHYKPLKQVNVSLAFPAFGHNDSDTYALKVLSTILGGGMSSRLFVSVRERKGLCYYIRTTIDFFDETGGFFIKTGLDVNRIDLALKTIFSELRKIKREKVTAQELQDAKEHIEGRLMIEYEDSFEVAQTAVEQEAFRKDGVQDFDKLLKSYQSVTASDIQRVAKRVLVSKSLCLTMVAPFKSDAKFQKLLKKQNF